MLMILALAALGPSPAPTHDSVLAAIGRPDAQRTVVSGFENLPGVVMVEDGVALLWSAESRSFELILDGAPVNDLVTIIDPRGWPAFQGAWTDSGPLIEGAVRPGRHALEWFVELSRPDLRPRLYYAGLTDDPPADYPQTCDCSDRINFCNTTECNNETVCQQTTSKICKWYDYNGGD